MKRFSFVLSAALLLGTLLPGLALPGSPLAQTAQAAPADAAVAPAPNQASTIAVHVDDEANILSPADEEMLADKTSQIPFPASVKDVHYLTFAENDDNFNDTIRFYAQDHNLKSPDQEYYADGHLFLAVGLDPRRMGVFQGQDVAADLNMLDPEGENGQNMDRINGVNQTMKPLLKEEKWAEGLLRGAQAAADVNLVVKNDDDEVSPGFAAGIVAAILGAVAAIFGIAIRSNRKRILAEAKKDYQYILEHHGDVATRLDEINIRAHSLSSPLANDALRQEWDTIHSNFVNAHETVGTLGELDSSSPNKEFVKMAGKLSKAAAAVKATVNAEENIEKLARMEHGDEETRRKELRTLSKDITKALAKAQGQSVPMLQELSARVDALAANVTAANFMDEFTDILTDYSAIVEAIQEKLYAESKVKQRHHDAPTLADAHWRPGSGYVYVPFSTVDSWHSSDVSHHESQQASSSSSSSGYSSGGFSGSGGSSSF